jgi:hypothetical protein
MRACACQMLRSREVAKFWKIVRTGHMIAGIWCGTTFPHVPRVGARRVGRVFLFAAVLADFPTPTPHNEYAHALYTATRNPERLTCADYNGYETSYTSYGAGGGAGGGGFIPNEGGSQQSPGGRRDYGQDSLRPVTIKQLLDAQIDPAASDNNKDSCKIDGSLVSQVRCSLPLPLLLHS